MKIKNSEIDGLNIINCKVGEIQNEYRERHYVTPEIENSIINSIDIYELQDFFNLYTLRQFEIHLSNCQVGRFYVKDSKVDFMEIKNSDLNYFGSSTSTFENLMISENTFNLHAYGEIEYSWNDSLNTQLPTDTVYNTFDGLRFQDNYLNNVLISDNEFIWQTENPKDYFNLFPVEFIGGIENFEVFNNQFNSKSLQNPF